MNLQNFNYFSGIKIILRKYTEIANRRSKQEQNKARLCFALQGGGRQSQIRGNFF